MVVSRKTYLDIIHGVSIVLSNRGEGRGGGWLLLGSLSSLTNMAAL
jgi:hypothetical protein